MLNYNVRGENIEVTPAMKEYVETKVGKIGKYFDEMPEANAHVNLKVYSDKDGKVEVTIPLPNIVLRAEETSPDLYGSIDLVSDKLERQVRKYKGKMEQRSRRGNNNKEVRDFKPVSPDILDIDDEDDDDDDSDINIVRTKRFDLKPMNAEEAVLQMEMLGHDFFVFLDDETQSTNIVYERDDGDFGLIETEQLENL